MRIRLISPRMTLRPMDSFFKPLMSPSLALLTLAGLTPHYHQVTIEDENIHPIRFKSPADLVGITVNVNTAPRAYEIASSFRKLGVKVVLGGIHVSACPEEAILHADAVCIGEGLDVWKTILADCENTQLKPFYQSGDSGNTFNVPVFNRLLVRKYHYLYDNILIATKGCPHTCEFCYNSCEFVQKSFRMRPLEEVFDEIRSHNTRHIMFVDDNLAGNRDYAVQLFSGLKSLNRIWNGAVSADIGNDPELLDQIAESGCRSLFIGFESINEKSLQSVRKSQNLVQFYENTIHEIHRRGIMINASIVFGFDDDDRTVFKKTVDWLVANRIETMTAHILTPYPGTRLFDKLKKSGRIINEDWSLYNTSNVVYQPLAMSPAELRAGYLWSYKEFYSLRNILKRSPQDVRQRVPYFLFNFFYRKFGKAVSIIGRLGLMRWIGKLARRLSYNIG